MRKFARFFVQGQDGQPRELLGSDGFIPIDGRLGKQRIMEWARDYAFRLRKIHTIVAFQVWGGSTLLNSQSIGKIIYLELR